MRLDAAGSTRECDGTVRANDELVIRNGRQGKGHRRTNGKTKPKRLGLRIGEERGVGDDVSTEERPAAVTGGGSACKDPLVREESHPIGTAVDARDVWRNTTGDTKWKPMLNSAPGGKIEFERSDILLPRQADREAAAAASCE